jgi:flagellar motor component MotA
MITKLFGFLLLTVCLAFVYTFDSSAHLTGSFRIFHWPAIFLTGLGPLGLVLLCSEWNKVQDVWKFLTKKSPAVLEKIQAFEGNYLHKLSQQFYAEGSRNIEKNSKSEISYTLKRVLNRISMRIPIQDIRDLVEKERSKTEMRMLQSIKITSLGVRMAPSIGMLGTILGMVQLLSHLKDPGNIGSHMSLALLTTFYGLFFSLVCWTPLNNRLEELLDVTMNGYDQILHWLKLLEERKPVHYFADNLNFSHFSDDSSPKKAQALNEKKTASLSKETRA